MDFHNFPLRDAFTEDGSIIPPRLFSMIYPGLSMIEDARPDFYIKRTDFDSILMSVYKTTGITIYKSYISGKCLDVRLIEEYKTMFVTSFLISEDIADRNYKISAKDLEVAAEMGTLDAITTSISNTTATEYNSRKLSPFVKESELVHAIVREFYYTPEFSSEANEFCDKYNEIKFDRDKVTPSTNNAIYTLGNGNNGMALTKHFIDTSKYQEDIIDSNYNDDFSSVYKNILKFLKSDENGLMLLTGEPGTGKSSLLMHLTTVCTNLNVRFVFIPSIFGHIISDPNFISFAIANLTDCILIFEDAEELLKTRSSNDSGVVSGILNITDGILGKLVKVKIIATVNKTTLIDPALTRKGRLKVSYSFGKLSIEKSNALLKKLEKSTTTNVPLTLSEIYNIDQESLVTSEKQIGFHHNR